MKDYLEWDFLREYRMARVYLREITVKYNSEGCFEDLDKSLTR